MRLRRGGDSHFGGCALHDPEPALNADGLGVVAIEHLGVALEDAGVEDEGGHNVGIDVGRRAAALHVALVVAGGEARDADRRTTVCLFCFVSRNVSVPSVLFALSL